MTSWRSCSVSVREPSRANLHNVSRVRRRRRTTKFSFQMAASVKIGTNSICPGCETVPQSSECTKCFICKSQYHAVCETLGDKILGTKTMVKSFVLKSTKSNFKFFCDVCLTNLEQNLVETENHAMNNLSTKISSLKKKLEKKLDEISTKMETSSVEQPAKQPLKDSIWNNQERLATVKMPPQKSVLVIKKAQSNEENVENHNKIQNTVIQNSIPVTKSFTNNLGDTVMICETLEDRDKLKNLISTNSQNIEMNAPSEKRVPITIVGLKREEQKEEIIKMLVLQNDFIKRFANQNDIKEHIKIYSVRPLKNNPNCYQAFASVTKTLHEGLNYHSNKITIGLATCKIYERNHIKRCNICQHFGHYARDCPTKEPICGKCGEDHHTNNCSNPNPRCINCTRSDVEDTNHHAISHMCPTMIAKQKSMNNRLNSNRQVPLLQP